MRSDLDVIRAQKLIVNSQMMMWLARQLCGGNFGSLCLKNAAREN
jgi:hypothetical protein